MYVYVFVCIVVVHLINSNLFSPSLPPLQVSTDHTYIHYRRKENKHKRNREREKKEKKKEIVIGVCIIASVEKAHTLQ